MILKEVWEGLLNTSLIEGFAVLFSLIYLFAISFHKIWGWYCAMISTALYVYICVNAQIFLEAGLQGFYLGMAFYGLAKWKQKKKVKLSIIVWPLKIHVLNILISSVFVVVLAQLFITFTSQQSPYLDAFSTVFSLLATFMVAKNVLENWVYWVVIDSVLVLLYASRELYLTSLQYFIFTIIAVIAFFKWYRIYKATNKNQCP